METAWYESVHLSLRRWAPCFSLSTISADGLQLPSGSTSAMPPSKRSAAVDSDGWSRTLRGHAYYDSDSDSDDEPPRGIESSACGSKQQSSGKQPSISEDARLIQQMDLSSRQDEAVFKANPWSIAKVNAATRPRQQPKASPAAHPTASKVPTKGLIVNAFKKQQERSQADRGNRSLRPSTVARPMTPAVSRAEHASTVNPDKRAAPKRKEPTVEKSAMYGRPTQTDSAVQPPCMRPKSRPPSPQAPENSALSLPNEPGVLVSDYLPNQSLPDPYNHTTSPFCDHGKSSTKSALPAYGSRIPNIQHVSSETRVGSCCFHPCMRCCLWRLVLMFGDRANRTQTLYHSRNWR